MIRVHKLTRYFNRGEINEVLALRGVDLDVREGDFITVIGSNGAGKSTFLNALAGVFPIDEGSIEIAGQDVTSWPEHKRAAFIGRVFQDPLLGTCPHATIEQNLSLAAKRGKRRGLGRGVRRSDRELFRERLVTLGLGLEDRLEDATGLLSGGQRQALTMLMATLVRPKVLLLDEHTAALDPKTAAQIMNLTDELVRKGNLTTMMVTHNMAQAIAHGNRLIMFHQGRIILDIAGEEKNRLKVQDLLERFQELGGDGCVTDRALLG
ncbi:ABC transporter ATP-binding protein [Paucidesulfovibrio longus]|uniref:ABC transporter ATP-binding protein n=1 Tax=Paucidesulfovibrio longus TaxID=889 RepID=UPI0003B73A4E|nr:ATP-binding cassette domain-containing protein [Paucidesulfovibrio longus]